MPSGDECLWVWARPAPWSYPPCVHNCSVYLSFTLYFPFIYHCRCRTSLPSIHFPPSTPRPRRDTSCGTPTTRQDKLNRGTIEPFKSAWLDVRRDLGRLIEWCFVEKKLFSVDSVWTFGIVISEIIHYKIFGNLVLRLIPFQCPLRWNDQFCKVIKFFYISKNHTFEIGSSV